MLVCDEKRIFTFQKSSDLKCNLQIWKIFFLNYSQLWRFMDYFLVPPIVYRNIKLWYVSTTLRKNFHQRVFAARVSLVILLFFNKEFSRNANKSEEKENLSISSRQVLLTPSGIFRLNVSRKPRMNGEWETQPIMRFISLKNSSQKRELEPKESIFWWNELANLS